MVLFTYEYEVLGALRLVGNLRSLIAIEKERRHYPPETHDFLGYATRVLTEIESHLGEARAKYASFSEFKQNVLRRNLLAIKTFLALLHGYLRRSLDADTLSIPEPLARVLNAVAKTMDPAAQVVVAATEHFNYFQQPTEQISEIDPMGIFKPFPETICLVSIPYSEARSAISNTLLFHELGHFFYKRNVLQSRIEPLRKTRFTQTLGGVHRDEFPKSTNLETDLYIYWDIVSNWAQEIYCDVFATIASGPAFLYAYCGLLAMLPGMGNGFRFGYSHPADNYRLKVVTDILRGDSLYEIVENETPDVHGWLVARLPEDIEQAEWNSDLGFRPRIEQHIVKFFLDHIAPIVVSAAKVVPERFRFDLDDFQAHHKKIQEVLSVLVSPTEADRDRSGELINQGNLRPTSVLTSAAIFSLKGFPNWPGNVDFQESEYLDRLNELTLKTLDDMLLVRRINRK